MSKNIASLVLLIFIGVLFSACNRQAVAQKSDKKYFYTCPMHPEIIEMKPGNCQKCGMKLEHYELEDMPKRKSANSSAGGHNHSGFGNSGGSGGCH